MSEKYNRAARRSIALEAGHYDGHLGTKIEKSGKKYNRNTNDENRYVSEEEESLLSDESFYFWNELEEE